MPKPKLKYLETRKGAELHNMYGNLLLNNVQSDGPQFCRIWTGVLTETRCGPEILSSLNILFYAIKEKLLEKRKSIIKCSLYLLSVKYYSTLRKNNRYSSYRLLRSFILIDIVWCPFFIL